MSTDNKHKLHFIKGVTADGNYIGKIGTNFNYAEMAYIKFFSDEYVTKVTPTAGTVDVLLSPDGDDFRTVENGSFSAANAYLTTRKQPSAVGLAREAKVTLAGITGATHFIAAFWRD